MTLAPEGHVGLSRSDQVVGLVSGATVYRAASPVPLAVALKTVNVAVAELPGFATRQQEVGCRALAPSPSDGSPNATFSSALERASGSPGLV